MMRVDGLTHVQVQGVVPWTAFMYRHPDVQYTELGFGGRDGLLVVWLFGREWTTRQFVLSSLQWYMMCLTWMHKREKPLLYINGFPEDIIEGGSGNTPPSLTSSMTIIILPFPDSLPARSLNTTPSPPTSCCKLAASGTLTLGATHRLVDGNIQVDPVSSMLGKLSLFRLWGRERSKEEVMSLKCTEGDLVMWWTGHWDAGACPATSDPTLRCGERRWNIWLSSFNFNILQSL